jgi:NAD(P)-dependent dehydrogenase (short-subunit alcohol dehydrogenase family)
VSGPGWLVLSGARSSIGQCVAERWHRRGGRVLGVSRTPDLPGVDVVITLDLSRPDGITEPLTEVLERGRIAPHAFVHAAGVVFADRARHTTADERRRTLAVNLESAFVLMNALEPRMGAGGSSVLVSSIDAAMAPAAGPSAIYGAAKAGLEALVRHLAVEWGPEGRRINAVRPGPMAGGMGVNADAARYAGRAADRRLTTAAEVADAVVFLLGEEASGITGQILTVDHGFGLEY